MRNLTTLSVIDMIVEIHSNMTRKNAYELTLGVYRQLRKLGAKILMSFELKEYFSDLEVSFLDENTAVAMCDIMIAIGGDGTIIHASHFAAEHDKPILGINAGRLGFLAGLEKEELSLLENLFSGKYTTDKRMMLKVSHYENGELTCVHHCLNDCTIGRGVSLRLCELEVKCDSRKINDYFADGIILATPTGSTAYSLSAGGPVVDTAIESLILTPICTHSLFSRSMIFKPDSKISVSVKNPDVCLPIYSCDGEIGISLSENSVIEIERAEKYVKLIRIKSDGFVEIFSQKLMERYSNTKGDNNEESKT